MNFNRIVSRLWPTSPAASGLAATSSPSSRYRLLSQIDSDADADPGRESHDNSDAASTHQSDRSETVGPRDAAATMLLKLGRSPSQRVPITPEDDARVLRRIDIALLPLMLAVYFLQALDKATLSYASVFGLIDDTGLRGDQFSWLSSVVYVAQLLTQLPFAWALVKLPIGRFTSVMVLGWGLTLTCMTWASRFPSLLAARFLLGAFEASIGPSFVAITQMWWRRREQTMRIGSWYCMNGLTWVFGSLVTYGLASIESPMKPYQIIFLFFGLCTVAVSGIMYFWMPDSPVEAKFLSDDDKVIAIERLRDNQMGVMSREWRFDHFSEALRDLKTWLWFAMIFCASVPSNGISTFGPLIIESFVSDPFQTMLFNVPVGISHVIAVSTSAYVSMRWKLKGPIIGLLCIPPIIGLTILLHVPHDKDHRGVLLLGYFCLSTFTGITPLIYAWSAQNTAGDTKRKSTSAIVFIGASAGNIIGPLLFKPKEAPEYIRGLRLNICFFVLIIFVALVATIHLRRLNVIQQQKRRQLGKTDLAIDPSLDRARGLGVAQAIRATEEEVGDDDDQCIDKAFADATDLENEDFVFVY